MSKIATQASLEDQRKAALFVEALSTEANKGGTFDSAVAGEFAKSALNGKTVQIPDRLQAILDDVGEKSAPALMSVLLDGVNEYKRRHGRKPSGDVLLNAMHVGATLTREGRKLAGVSLDSATQDHHDQLSLHPSGPAIGLMTAIAQAIPFAGYAPVDMKSNEGRIIIVNHQSANAAGTYAKDASLDGTASGEPFLSSVRALKVASSGMANDHYVGTFRAKMTDYQTADGASAAVKVLRGRTNVYVAGLPVARDSAAGSGTSAVSGVASIAGTDYVIGGSVDPSAGTFDITSTPALPAGVRDEVVVEAVIDFEDGQEALTARVGVKATTYQIFANPDRGIITASIDSQTQFENETGFSPLAHGSEIARIQWYNERHYRALRYLKRVATLNGNVGTFNFDWTNFGQQKTRAQIWGDFMAVLGAVSQKMALETVDHGVTHLYVPANVAVQMKALPAEIFTPSGLSEQAGIYRVGRLFGTYEVYYCPKTDICAEGSSTGTILCIGTSASTARNPIVVGDVVAPVFTPRGVGDDMKQGYNYYSRGFTTVNPHKPSALGAALINVTNLF